MEGLSNKVKTFLMVIMIVVTASSGITLVYGYEEGIYHEKAQILKELGLFKGSDRGFELNRKANRVEGAIMLVRLLGEEKEASKEIYTHAHPFIDVPAWASSYVGYLYKNGLTNGVSPILFGSRNDITPAQYTTMVLRALGYSDEDGDFNINNALDFANKIDILDDNEVSVLKSIGNNNFLRDYIVMVSYNSLYAKIQNQDNSLIYTLVKGGAISGISVEKACKIDNLLRLNLLVEGYLDEGYPEKESHKNGEVRGVWISYLELQTIFPNKTEGQFKEAIKGMFKNIKEAGLNTVIVQVRPFGDAIYPSEIFPWSYIITGIEGINPGYDPLGIMVEEAHAQGLDFEAWINPYRIRNNTKPLSADNKALKWLEDGSNKVIKVGNGIYYNPASMDVQRLITDGVIEIIEKYDVDGIHFDDYFYPTTDANFDKVDYERYKLNGGILNLSDWRRENVNQLVRAVYKGIKDNNPGIKFGISPQAIISKSYNEQYTDIYKWLSNPGYVDYICPQIYFGYEHSTYPYDKVVKQWVNLMKNPDIQLYVGLAAYKVGREDSWAGSGKAEWMKATSILQRMIEDGRKEDNYLGFILFRYDSLFNPPSSLKEQIDLEMNEIKK